MNPSILINNYETTVKLKTTKLWRAYPDSLWQNGWKIIHDEVDAFGATPFIIYILFALFQKAQGGDVDSQTENFNTEPCSNYPGVSRKTLR